MLTREQLSVRVISADGVLVAEMVANDVGPALSDEDQQRVIDALAAVLMNVLGRIAQESAEC